MNEYNPFSLKGKTILVTGASSGIGRATTVECSRMGARVIISARNEQRLKETLDTLDGKERGHEMIVADLTDDDKIAEVVSGLPPLDGAVLCAGILCSTPLQFANREKFDKVFGINFFALVELLRLLVKKKRLSKGSSVSIIASVGGVKKVSIGNGIYDSAKAALNSCVKTFARELGPHGIRVNSVCPGMVETPLIEIPQFDAESRKADEGKYPLGRYGRPEEIAYASVYLLSDAAAWITGSELIIDGGVSLA